MKTPDGIIYIDEINWKDEYEKHCKESQQCDKEFAAFNLNRDQSIFDAFEGSAEELVTFKKGFQEAKTLYGNIVKIRTDMLCDEKFFLRKKTKELIEAEQKIKDLIAECELYSNCWREIEAHKLSKCVRFLQTFRNKAKFKLTSIYRAGKNFMRCFLPDKYDGRSAIYKTLQQHLGKEDNLGRKINKDKHDQDT